VCVCCVWIHINIVFHCCQYIFSIDFFPSQPKYIILSINIINVYIHRRDMDWICHFFPDFVVHLQTLPLPLLHNISLFANFIIKHNQLIRTQLKRGKENCQIVGACWGVCGDDSTIMMVMIEQKRCRHSGKCFNIKSQNSLNLNNLIGNIYQLRRKKRNFWLIIFKLLENLNIFGLV